MAWQGDILNVFGWHLMANRQRNLFLFCSVPCESMICRYVRAFSFPSDSIQCRYVGPHSYYDPRWFAMFCRCIVY